MRPAIPGSGRTLAPPGGYSADLLAKRLRAPRATNYSAGVDPQVPGPDDNLYGVKAAGGDSDSGVFFKSPFDVDRRFGINRGWGDVAGTSTNTHTGA